MGLRPGSRLPCGLQPNSALGCQALDRSIYIARLWLVFELAGINAD